METDLRGARQDCPPMPHGTPNWRRLGSPGAQKGPPIQISAHGLGSTKVRGLFQRASTTAHRIVQKLRRRLPQGRLAAEIAAYAKCETVHDLPPIYNYWSERYLMPIFRACGFETVEGFFLEHLIAACRRDRTECPRIASVGAGNCDLEVRLAGLLRLQGVSSFVFECMDLNPQMLDRGQAHAARAGVGEHFRFWEGDAARWQPSGRYAACLANHSLHHITRLESVFDRIWQAIHPTGVFVASDMIGRNGHRRWPEALAMVQDLWRELPDRCKYHHQLRQFHPRFVNWDCATDGNEGVRAQDILPLLNDRFHFDVFCAFSNIISVFVDRGYGPNFDIGNPADTAFIDKVAAMDDVAIDSGIIKPTQMVAALRTEFGARTTCYRERNPESSIRRARWWQ